MHELGHFLSQNKQEQEKKEEEANRTALSFFRIDTTGMKPEEVEEAEYELNAYVKLMKDKIAKKKARAKQTKGE